MLAAQQIWTRGRVNKSQSHGITVQPLLSGPGGQESFGFEAAQQFAGSRSNCGKSKQQKHGDRNSRRRLVGLVKASQQLAGGLIQLHQVFIDCSGATVVGKQKLSSKTSRRPPVLPPTALSGQSDLAPSGGSSGNGWLKLCSPTCPSSK